MNKNILIYLLTIVCLTSCEKVDLDKYLEEKQVVLVPTEDGTLVETGLVDLGLSVKWAACNLDANSTDHFVSNCSESGSAFNWSVPTTVNVESLEEIGGTELDNATNLLGSGWRTPSKLEFTELQLKCFWSKFTYKGIKGVLITGPSGNAIFLPLNYYWTSSQSNYTRGNLYFYDVNEHENYPYQSYGNIKGTQDCINPPAKCYIRPVYGSLK